LQGDNSCATSLGNERHKPKTPLVGALLPPPLLIVTALQVGKEVRANNGTMTLGLCFDMQNNDVNEFFPFEVRKTESHSSDSGSVECERMMSCLGRYGCRKLDPKNTRYPSSIRYRVFVLFATSMYKEVVCFGIDLSVFIFFPSMSVYLILVARYLPPLL